jgi:hypothetical protein
MQLPKNGVFFKNLCNQDYLSHLTLAAKKHSTLSYINLGIGQTPLGHRMLFFASIRQMCANDVARTLLNLAELISFETHTKLLNTGKLNDLSLEHQEEIFHCIRGLAIIYADKFIDEFGYEEMERRVHWKGYVTESATELVANIIGESINGYYVEHNV